MPINRRSAHPARRARQVSAASATLAGLFLTGFFAARSAADAGTPGGPTELALPAGRVGTPAPAMPVPSPTTAATTTRPAAPSITAPPTTTSPAQVTVRPVPSTAATTPPTTARAGRTATPAVPGATPRSSSRGS